MDKEIIINGVDVAGCEFYRIEANELYPKAQYCGSMRNTFCANEPNCYYKQLKRLEFELKVTKADYEASEQENAELKAENEKLKHSNENLRLALKTYEMPEVIKVLTDWRTGELALRINKYKQTLQEIKAIVCGNYEIIDPQGRKDILKLINKTEIK